MCAKAIQPKKTEAVVVAPGATMAEMIRVIGAFLESDADRIINLMDEKPNNKAYQYLCLTALVQIGLKDSFIEFGDNGRESRRVFEPLLKIIKEGDYETLPFAKSPDEQSSPEEYIRKAFLEVIERCLRDVLSTSQSYGDRELQENLKKLSLVREIVTEHKLIDTQLFFKELAKVVEEDIDRHFCVYFCNSIKEVYKTRKHGALRMYFMHQLFLYNDDFSKKDQVRLKKMYEACMRLESKYASSKESKSKNKPSEKTLLAEVNEMMNTL